MRRSQKALLWLSISILGALTLSPASMGQASRGSEAAAPTIEDWTYHHVIFSRPATAEQARRLEQEPRYLQEVRHQSPSAPAGSAFSPELQPHPRRGSSNAGLWSENLGTGATMGAGNYPAKYSLTTTAASCSSDFVVYPTGLAGSPTQASIVAYSNLYSGCTAPVPSVYWAYYIDAGNTIQSSPVFSLDGTEIAFMQRDTSGDAILVVLKWKASTTEDVGHPDSVGLIGSYATCHTPCRAELNLRDAGVPPSDTNSSIFVDYPSDTAFVGDDSGYLHKFSPVFNGVPAEVGGGIWPVQVNPSAPTALTSPVYDSVTGNVFVTDNGGFLYRVNSSTAAVTESAQLDFSVAFDVPAGPGIVQGPILDYTAGELYVFAASDGSGGCPLLAPDGSDCSAVYQLPRNFLAGDFGSEAVVGSSTIEPAAPNPMYSGAFDSAYKNSSDATGNLYVCGNTGGAPTLYQVPIVAGVMSGEGTALTALSTANTPCSPVTDVMNANVPVVSFSGGPTEWVFASADNSGVSSGCASGGCVLNFKVTPWQPNTVYAVGQEVLDSHLQIQVSTGGTSGLTAPIWGVIVGNTVIDHTMHWLDQGVLTSTTPAAWVANKLYAKGAKILDPNNNIELATNRATSGATIPTFNKTPNVTTADGVTLVWNNLGAPGTAALAAASGTSGIIVDNTVAPGTEAGASQIYFSILGSQTCTGGGTGGCAVQASQSALQ
jgi:hypothetical protein